MRIVHLSACAQMGGAETSLLELLRSVRLTQPGWDLRLVLGEEGPLRSKVEALGIKTEVVPFPKALARMGDSGLAGKLGASMGMARAVTAAAAYRKRLRRVLSVLRPQLIHATGFKMQILGCWTAPRIPLLWHIHDYVSTRPLMGRLMGWHARWCSLAVVNSHSVAEDFGRVCPGLPARTVYNAIDLDRFSPEGSRQDLDQLAGLPAAAGDTVRVGLVGTYARWKGHLVFLDALARARKEVPALRGYVIGGPIYQTPGSQYSLDELRAYAENAGLGGNAGFIGFQDPAPIMRSLDVVVHASTKPEPFGMVIVEGMACGRAVIASRAGGAAEIVEPELSALIFNPGDTEGLVRQLTRVARDGELRSRLGKAGRTRASELCRTARLGGEIAAIYSELGGSPDAGAAHH